MKAGKAGKTGKAASKRPTRGALSSMRVTDGFRQFVLDQLSAVERLRARSMFGGIGLYAGDAFFGIVAADVLYFKVGNANRGEYEAAGSTAFRPFTDRPMSMSYYAVPLSVLESAFTLGEWAERSIAVARSKTAASKSTVAHQPKRSRKR